MNKTKIFQQSVSEISRSRQIPACFFAGWCLLMASSCTLHEMEEGRDVVGNGEKIEMSFSLSVSPESAPRTRSFAFAAAGCTEMDNLVVAGNSNVTRATGLTPKEETTLTDLCVVQYNEKGTQTSKPAYYSKLTYTTNEAGDTLTLDLTLDRNGDINTVYLLANVGDQTKSFAGKTETEFKAQVLATSSVFTADGMLQNDRCVLIGSWTGKLADAGKKMSLTRAVAKISFSYEVVAGAENFSFTTTALKLCNVPTQLQYIEPKSQLPEISYTAYVTTHLTPSITNACCWYLPENLAGKAPEDVAVYSEKEKIGTGVSDATYIELTGDVVQNGVSYPGVVFKLYPGSQGSAGEGYNDYNVMRNSHHAIHVKLTGIDFSDKRFTLGKLTPIERPDTLGCGIGETASVQIVARPGSTWSFLLPAWLSACIDNKTDVPPLYNVSYFGSAVLRFTTTGINPEATPRDFKFRVDTAVVTVTQDTAAFWVYPQALVLANTGAEQSITVNATEGLSWTVGKQSGSDSIKAVTELSQAAGTRTIAFNAIENKGKARSTVFNFTTVGSFPARKLALRVNQEARDAILLTIDQALLTALGKVSGFTNSKIPPFNYDGRKEIDLGTDYQKKIVEGGGSYRIEVEAGQFATTLYYGPNTNVMNAINYCANLREGEQEDWRVPTLIELFAIYLNRDKIEVLAGVSKLKRSIYWTSSVLQTNEKIRGTIQFYTSSITINSINGSDAYIRCVRTHH